MDSRPPASPLGPVNSPIPPAAASSFACLPFRLPERPAARSRARARALSFCSCRRCRSSPFRGPLVLVSHPSFVRFFQGFHQSLPLCAALNHLLPFRNASPSKSPHPTKIGSTFFYSSFLHRPLQFTKRTKMVSQGTRDCCKLRGRTSRGALLDVPANKYVSLFHFSTFRAFIIPSQFSARASTLWSTSEHAYITLCGRIRLAAHLRVLVSLASTRTRHILYVPNTYARWHAGVSRIYIARVRRCTRTKAAAIGTPCIYIYKGTRQIERATDKIFAAFADSANAKNKGVRGEGADEQEGREAREKDGHPGRPHRVSLLLVQRAKSSDEVATHPSVRSSTIGKIKFVGKIARISTVCSKFATESTRVESNARPARFS